MARPNQEEIETFMSITGSSESVALRTLEEHGGNLNEAVNAYFNAGDRNTTHESSLPAPPPDDSMEIDDSIQFASRRPLPSFFPSARNMNPFSLLDPNFGRRFFGSDLDFMGHGRDPFVSHPREVREIPIEVKDGQSGNSGLAPRIEDVTETSHEQGPEIHGTVMIDDEDDEDTHSAPTSHVTRLSDWNRNVLGNNFGDTPPRSSAPTEVFDLPDDGNDIEEEMIKAAIEASKRDAETGYPSDPLPERRQSKIEDPERDHAVSLSSKTAEEEKALRELGGKIGPSEPDAHKSVEMEDTGTLESSNRRMEAERSSVRDEAEDVEEQPLVRHNSRHTSGSVDTTKEIRESDVIPSSRSQQQRNVNSSEHNESDFPSAEWGGISSEEHDEAVMLEAALFGGIPEGSGYHLPYASHHFMQNGFDRTLGPYPDRIPRPPSPSLTAQRLIREQQDDEYFASLQADREKELKAREEAKARRLEEQAARDAAAEEIKRNEDELLRKLEEKLETERQLAAKEASLPQEPSSDDENAVTLLVRMSDGSRQGRRFVKTDRLQSLFDFIDVGRVLKPGTYRLVRPYPRRAFSNSESGLTLNELGLVSKQEVLFLELI